MRKATHNENESRINELIEQCKKRKKTLLIYAHNTLYDYHAVTHGLEKKEHYQYSTDPFIVDMKDENGHIYTKWLSTTSLWRGALSTMGEALGLPKTETPEWLKQDTEQNPTIQELANAHEYMERDARIIKEFMDRTRTQLMQKGMKPRWIISSSQIGIQNLIKELKLSNNREAFFYDLFKQQL